MKKILLFILLLSPWVSLTAQEGLFAKEKGFTIESAWASGGEVREHPEDPDFNLLILWGGFQIKGNSVTLRGDRALLFLDKDDYRKGMRSLIQGRKRPVSDGPCLTNTIGENLLPGLQLLAKHFFSSSEKKPEKKTTDNLKNWLDASRSGAVRSIFAEGKVILWSGNKKILSANNLYLDLVDGSFSTEDCVLRLPSTSPSGQKTTMMIRSPLISQNGGRIRCNDSSFTFCDFAKPHYNIAAGTLDGWKEKGFWVFRTTHNVLWIQGLPVLWLPSLNWREDEKGPLPLKEVKVGRKSRWGPFLFTTWGRSLQRYGSRLNRTLGLPESDFKGDWRLTNGITRDRGFPVWGNITYESRDTYSGNLHGFWLDDHGDEIRGPVRTEWNGDPLPHKRLLLFTENQINLSPTMRLDLQAWKASDPGVIPEFYEGRHKNRELFETSAHFSWRSKNRALSVLGKKDINDFSYAPDRGLADYCDEYQPSISFLDLAEPLFSLPWGQQVILSTEVDASRFRRHYTPGMNKISDRVFRLYGEAELSAPFSLGPIRFRPYTIAGCASYDETVAGGSTTNNIGEVGLAARLHLSRFFPITSETWGIQGLLHQMDPELTYANRFAPDENPANLFQFDIKDQLTKRESVSLFLRNRFLTMRKIEGKRRPITLFRADFGFEYFPDETQNNGNNLGNLDFDIAWQPSETGYRAANSISFAAQGAYDLDESELAWLHTYGNIPVGPVSLGGGWVRGRDSDGFLYCNASLSIIDRWRTTVSYSYNLDRGLSTGYYFSLTRVDHDWSIGLVLNYDEGQGDYSVGLEFWPGGWLMKQRDYTVGGLNPMDTLM